MATYKTSILVTGGTLGLGYYAALAIARQCPDSLVVIASRSDAANAAAKLNAELKHANIKYMRLDLGSLDEVRKFAQAWENAKNPPISALLLNAGLQFPGAMEKNGDGIEKTFAVNHVGHSLLFHLLAPYLTADARIVVTSSGTHDPKIKGNPFKPDYTTAEEVARPSKASEKKSNGRDRYATSKVANVLWTYALARRFSASTTHARKTVVAFDPGLMPGTGLARDASATLKFLNAHLMPRLIPLLRLLLTGNVHTPAESGANLAWITLGEEAKAKNGVYYEMRKTIPTSDVSMKEDLQEGLWRWTVDFVGRDDVERERFDRIE